jgi:hypothetical protein
MKNAKKEKKKGGGKFQNNIDMGKDKWNFGKGKGDEEGGREDKGGRSSRGRNGDRGGRGGRGRGGDREGGSKERTRGGRNGEGGRGGGRGRGGEKESERPKGGNSEKTRPGKVKRMMQRNKKNSFKGNK